jgi:hypothetical protein
MLSGFLKNLLFRFSADRKITVRPHIPAAQSFCHDKHPLSHQLNPVSWLTIFCLGIEDTPLYPSLRTKDNHAPINKQGSTLQVAQDGLDA